MRINYIKGKGQEIHGGIITIGSFDGVHVGHRSIITTLIETAKELNTHSVIITFDPHPRHVLQPDNDSFKLLNTLDEKIELIKACGVDYVVVVPFTKKFSQTSPMDYIQKFLIDQFKPKAIVIGYDHRFGKDREGNIDLIREYVNSSAEIIEIKKKQIDQVTVSSTTTRKALDEGNILLANSLLSYAYSLSGVVVRGDQFGRRLGFPTANLKINFNVKLIPKNGIYAATIQINNDIHRGMLYIGTRPSINGSSHTVIEVHVFDFNEDIYGQEISIHLKDFIREDEKLESKEDLKELIKKDEVAVKYFFKNDPID